MLNNALALVDTCNLLLAHHLL
ncbi:MAG: hypothetical protein RIT49_592, partial [Actinomycetota bacterium]